MLGATADGFDHVGDLASARGHGDLYRYLSEDPRTQFDAFAR